MSHHNQILLTGKKRAGMGNFRDSEVLMLGDFDRLEIYPSLKIISDKLSDMNYDNLITGRLNNVCAEVINNMSRHGNYNTIAPPYFCLHIRDTHINIRSGNVVNGLQRGYIIEKLGTYCKIRKHEFQLFYRESLKNASITDSGSASLGLLEIAYSCQQAISFNFESLSNDLYYYELNAIIETAPVHAAMV